MMLPLYHHFRRTILVPRFPSYGSKIASGMNFNLVEEILTGIQARLCLYLMTPDTGEDEG